MTQTCSRCGDERPLVEFPRNRSRRNGRAEYCFPCKRGAAKQSRDRDGGLSERQRVAGWRDRLRDETFAAYGGACACCGEDTREFLCIDHIAGGGREHRRALGREGVPFYSWLRQQGYPEGYRVLCHNCNAAYGLRGYCPHQTSVRKEVAA